MNQKYGTADNPRGKISPAAMQLKPENDPKPPAQSPANCLNFESLIHEEVRSKEGTQPMDNLRRDPLKLQSGMEVFPTVACRLLISQNSVACTYLLRQSVNVSSVRKKLQCRRGARHETQSEQDLQSKRTPETGATFFARFQLSQTVSLGGVDCRAPSETKVLAKHQTPDTYPKP